MLSRRRGNESQLLRCDIFPTGRVVSVLWEAGGPAGGKWSSARPRARRERCRKVKREGTNGRERTVGKAAGDECVFIPGAGPGLADEGGSDATPDTAGGERGHGAASQDRVIHRYFSDPFDQN